MNKSVNFSVFKNSLQVISAVLLVFFLYKIQSILIVLFISFVITSAIDPIVEKLSTKMSRQKALIAVAVIGFLSILLLWLPFLNVFLKQTVLLVNQMPSYWAQITAITAELPHQVSSVGWIGIFNKLGFGKVVEFIVHTGILSDTSKILSAASGIGQKIILSSIDLTKNFGYAAMYTFISAIIISFMLGDKDRLKNKLFSFFPKFHRETAEKIGTSISKKVGGYVFSQLIIILTMSILVTLGLSLLKIEFSFILGMMAGFLEIIPGIGPLITVIVIVLVALAQKPILALWALLLYMFFGWIIDSFVRPFIMSKFLNMHPLTLMFSMVTGSLIFGAIGLILAPAIAATVCVLIDELYLKKIEQD